MGPCFFSTCLGVRAVGFRLKLHIILPYYVDVSIQQGSTYLLAHVTCLIACVFVAFPAVSSTPVDSPVKPSKLGIRRAIASRFTDMHFLLKGLEFRK